MTTTLKLKENIAAVSYNFALQDLELEIELSEMTRGWAGLLGCIIEWAEVLTELEPDTDMFDWYLTVDDYVECIAKHISEHGEMPDITKVKEYALAAIDKNAYKENDDDSVA